MKPGASVASRRRTPRRKHAAPRNEQLPVNERMSSVERMRSAKPGGQSGDEFGRKGRKQRLWPLRKRRRDAARNAIAAVLSK
jgi:hypothetical protein